MSAGAGASADLSHDYHVITMSKKRSLESRRRQRKRQKARKRASASPPSSSTRPPGKSESPFPPPIATSSGLPGRSESPYPLPTVTPGTPGSPLQSSDTFGSPGSPPSSPLSNKGIDFINDFRSCIREQDDELLRRIWSLPLQKQCEELTELFKHRTDVLNYFRDRVDAHEIEKAGIVTECRRKILIIRSFWRDKLYHGGTRSGKIVRAALATKQ